MQRRLVKSLEDLSVMYDTTVRNSSGQMIQVRASAVDKVASRIMPCFSFATATMVWTRKPWRTPKASTFPTSSNM